MQFGIQESPAAYLVMRSQKSAMLSLKTAMPGMFFTHVERGSCTIVSGEKQ